MKVKFANLVATPLVVALLLAASALDFTLSTWACYGRQADSSVVSGAASNAVAERVYGKALETFNQADTVHYEHNKDVVADQVVVDGDHCQALCDCSGFVSYLLHTAAPQQFHAMELSTGRKHPQAYLYTEFFAKLDPAKATDGWIGVDGWSKLRKGDLISWSKPIPPDSVDGHRKGNTGHVMVVESPAGKPQTIKRGEDAIRFIEIPVIDSSSVDHFPPEQLPPRAHQIHRDGLGRGCVRLVLNDQDKVIGYWEGTYWNEGGKAITKPTLTDQVVFARLVPMEQ